MNPDQIPTVSTFRVEKPGKSKFAPSIGSRKASSTVTTSTTSTSEPVTEAVSSTSIDDKQQRVTETETVKETEKEKESLTESTESTESTVTTAPNNIATVGKKIESIQSRRQKEDISSSNVINSTSSSFNPHLSSISAPAGPKDAASIATSTSSNNGTSEKRTMSYFLKDSGEGREMPGAQSSTVTSTSVNSATTSDPALSPSKTRRIVNLRNIKAPPRSSTTSTALAPQVRVVDGAIVYDEKFSAAINMNNSNSTGSSYADLEQELEYIDEDDENGKHLTSATYSAKAKGSNRWNSNETDLFYEALSMCGTDFSMIQTLFPHRTRAQIKGKYKLEEKANPQRINDSLKGKKAFDPTFKDRVNEIIKK